MLRDVVRDGLLAELPSLASRCCPMTSQAFGDEVESDYQKLMKDKKDRALLAT